MYIKRPKGREGSEKSLVSEQEILTASAHKTHLTQQV